MSTSPTPGPDDRHLIDRHLAGLLTPAEEDRLEHLLRTSPAWAERYRKAEALAGLLHDHLGPSSAPERAKAAVRRIAASEREPVGAAPRRGVGRSWALAACLLVGLAGAYLLMPGEGPDALLPVAHGQVDRPLKDLVRGAEVGVIGEVVHEHGRLRLRVERTLFGHTGGRTFRLPDALRPGRRVVIFGTAMPADPETPPGDAAGWVLAEDGVVPLDVDVTWEGARLTPTETEARVLGATTLRTLDACLDDLHRFTGSLASRAGRGADGLQHSADVTARFLGRFPPDAVRDVLLGLLVDVQRHPQVRRAAGEALAEAEPLACCRRVLTMLLSGDAEALRAETEDGHVVLGCLALIQRHGPADLAEDLKALEARLRCEALRQALAAALGAVSGTGSRTPTPPADLPRPQRIRIDGSDAVVMAGCDGRQDRLLVVFPADGRLAPVRALANRAVQAGFGVLVLPPRATAVGAWIREAVATGLVRDQGMTFLGRDEGAMEAVRAAKRLRPARLVLVGEQSANLANEPAPKGVESVIFDPRQTAQEAVRGWVLRPWTEGERSENPDPGLWIGVDSGDDR